jgi:hypothetical protein
MNLQGTSVMGQTDGMGNQSIYNSKMGGLHQ